MSDRCPSVQREIARAVRALVLCSIIGVGACLPEYSAYDPAVPLVIVDLARDHRLGCLFAGLSNSTANSAVLACAPVEAPGCGTFLTFAVPSQRTALTDSVNALGVAHADCLVAASNTLTEVNGLTLPASLLMKRAGGTSGAHTTSNARAEAVASCAGQGLDAAGFLGGATRLTTAAENAFLGTARGLVAARDAGGLCRAALGLTSAENALAAAMVSGSVTMFGSCDYGVDDGGKTDCPAALQRSELLFPGISSW